MKKKKEEVIDTKLEFLSALDNIVKEKNIDKQVVIDAMEYLFQFLLWLEYRTR